MPQWPGVGSSMGDTGEGPLPGQPGRPKAIRKYHSSLGHLHSIGSWVTHRSQWHSQQGSRSISSPPELVQAGWESP